MKTGITQILLRLFRARPGVYLALATLPAALLALIIRYGYDAPYMDTWEFISVVSRYYVGDLAFHHFWEEQNYHRLLIPRILLLGMIRLSNWNHAWELGLIFLLACLSFTWLACQPWKIRAIHAVPAPWWAILLPALLLFSPSQWQVWLWGWHVCIAIVAAGLYGACGALSCQSRAAFPTALVMAVLISYSMLNGLVIWPAGLLAILLAGGKRVAWRAILWAACGTVTVAVYMHGLKGDGSLPAFSSLASDALNFTVYVLAFLGNPIVNYHLYGAALAGVAGLVLFLAGIILALRSGSIPRPEAAVWFGIAACSVGCALMVAIGRHHHGLIQALSSRYIVFANGLWLACVAMLARLFATSSYAAMRRGIYTAIIVIVFSSIATAITGVYRADVQWDAFQLGRASLIGEGPPENLRWLHPRPERILPKCDFLREYHLSVFRKHQGRPSGRP